MYHCAINPKDVTWIVNTLYATRIHLSIINLLPFLVAERPPRRLSWWFRPRLGPWAPRVLDHLICSLFQAATPMAYRRRQGISRSPTFKEEIHYPPNEDNFSSSNYSSSPASSSLAAQASRASAAHRESSLSSPYGGDSAFSGRERDDNTFRSKVRLALLLLGDFFLLGINDPDFVNCCMYIVDG